MRKGSRALVLLVLGGAVAGWGCALLSPGPEFNPEQYRQEQLARQVRKDELLRQFDALAATQQGTPDAETLLKLSGYLAEYGGIPPGCGSNCADLKQRHLLLANWGDAQSEYWMGRFLDPLHHTAGWKSSDTQPALDWYRRAAAQGVPFAQEELDRLQRAIEAHRRRETLQQAFDVQTQPPDPAQQAQLLALVQQVQDADCKNRTPCADLVVLPYLGKLGDWGNAEAQFQLGRWYDPANHPQLVLSLYRQYLGQARDWYGRAAAQGRADAAAALAQLPPAGSDIPKEPR